MILSRSYPPSVARQMSAVYLVLAVISLAGAALVWGWMQELSELSFMLLLVGAAVLFAWNGLSLRREHRSLFLVHWLGIAALAVTVVRLLV